MRFIRAAAFSRRARKEAFFLPQGTFRAVVGGFHAGMVEEGQQPDREPIRNPRVESAGQ